MNSGNEKLVTMRAEAESELSKKESMCCEPYDRQDWIDEMNAKALQMRARTLELQAKSMQLKANAIELQAKIDAAKKECEQLEAEAKGCVCEFNPECVLNH